MASGSAFTRIRDDPLAAFVLDHASLLITAASTALVAIRAMAVAGFQPETAVALLSSGGLTGLVLATIETALPMVAPAIAILLWTESARFRGSPWLSIVWGVSLPIALVVSLGASIGYLLLGIAAPVGVSLIIARRRGDPTLTPVGLALLLTPAIALALIPSGRPWFPPERITIGAETFTGYVLDESAGWTRVLVDNPRYVRIAASGSITARASCVTQTDPLWTPIGGLARRSGLPPC